MNPKKGNSKKGSHRGRVCKDGHVLPVLVFGTGEAGAATRTLGRKLVTNPFTADQYPGWTHVSSFERAREMMMVFSTKRKRKKTPIAHCAFPRQTRCTCSPRRQGREAAPWDCPVLARRLPSHQHPRLCPPRYLGTSYWTLRRRRPLAHDCE